MLESIEADTKVLIFRISMAFFVGTAQVCMALLAKLVKDHSQRLYFLYSGLCLGLFLAKTIGAAAFGSSSRTNSSTLLWDISFAGCFLCIVVLHLLKTENASFSAYEKLASQPSSAQEDIDEDDDLDMEASDHLSPTSSSVRMNNMNNNNSINSSNNRNNANNNSHNNMDDNADTTHIFSTWRLLALLAFLLEASAAGWTVGVTEHKNLSLFLQVCAKDLVIAAIFGVFCEETITIAPRYLQHIGLAACATPIGLLVGTFFAVSSANNNNDNDYNNGWLLFLVNGAASGLWTGLAVCVALPFDRHVLAHNNLSNSSNSSNDWQKVRIVSVVLGFCLAALVCRS